MMRYGSRRMRGQALIMFVLVSAALVMVLGLAIDASGGWWKSQRQNDAIEIAKESALSRSNEIKFDATDSTRAIDEIVYASLTENLKDIESSEVSVTSWEVPETKTFGFSSIPVKNTITFTINPYSSTEVWRQDANGHGCRLAKHAGKPVGQETYETLSAASGISDALNAAIEKGLAELS